MWIEQQKNGKFKYVERYKDPITGKWRKVSMTSTKQTNSVKKEMALKLQEKIDNKLESSSMDDIPLSKLAELYLKAYKGTVKESTFYKTEKRLFKLLIGLEHIRTSQLKARHFNELFISRLDHDGYTYATVSLDKSLIDRLLTFGLQNNYLDDWDLPKKLTVPQKNLNQKDDYKYLEKDELDYIINYFNTNHQAELARMVTIQVNTGLRYGEMISIDYNKSIDFDNKTLEINRIFDYENKIYTLPKTNKTRTVILNDKAIRSIKDQIKMDKMRILQYGLSKEDVCLFRSNNGNPRRPKDLNNRMKSIKIENKRLTSHIFRHTYVSLAAEQGIDKEAIAHQLGHANTKMIDQIYLHVTKKGQEKIEAELKQFSI